MTEERKAGTAFATGRPATGRKYPITIRISEEAYERLHQQRNKSEYIDDLIKKDARSI